MQNLLLVPGEWQTGAAESNTSEKFGQSAIFAGSAINAQAKRALLCRVASGCDCLSSGAAVDTRPMKSGETVSRP
jgi:hypothetical protein